MIKKLSIFLTIVLCSSIVVNAVNYEELYFNPDKKIGLVYYTQPDYTPSEKLIRNSIILSTNSNVAIIRGATRYIDIDSARSTPIVIDGVSYLPIEFMSKTFKFYYEESPLLFRDDDLNELKLNSINYYGQIYMPLREIAEKFGKDVYYSNGIIIIDKQEIIDEINLNPTAFDYISTTLCGDIKSGNTYYVSKRSEANDTNPGTEILPFKTLNWAGKVARPGDTVIIEEGVYNELFNPKNNGTFASPITYKAKEGAKVSINQTQKISGFTKYKGDIYVAPVNVDLGQGRNQVFKDGKAVPEARHPNEKNSNAVDVSHLGLSNMWPIQGDIILNANEPYTARSEHSLNQEEENYWVGATFIGQVEIGWCFSTATVMASKKGELTLGNTSVRWWYPNFGMEWGGEDFGYLTGHMNALDIDDEWYIKDNKIYYYMPKNVDPESFTLEIKAGIVAIDLNNRENIIIDGINIFGGSIIMDNTKLCTVKNAKIDYVSHFTSFKEARDGYIDEGVVSANAGSPQAGKVGIYSGGDSNVFYNCQITNSAGAAIYDAGKYTLIQNNKIVDCGYGGTYVSGIFISYDPRKPANSVRGGHEIYNNEVGGAARSVFNVYNNETMFVDYSTPYVPMEIAYNHFYNGGIMSGRDGAIIYLYLSSLGDKENKTRVHNNTLMDYYGNDDEHMGAGIYYDSGVYMSECFNNVIFYTNDNAKFTKPYYNNLIPERNWLSITSAWNQSEAGMRPNGKSDLIARDYPKGIPFVTGVKSNKRPEMNDDDWYFVKKQTEEVEINDGFANIKKLGETVKYENVDFKDGSNRMAVLVKGDLNKPKNVFEIRIGNFESRPIATLKYDLETPSTKFTDTIYVDLPLKKGVYDVYITSLSDNETQIGKMFVDKTYKDTQDSFVYDEVSVDLFHPSKMGQLLPKEAELPPSTVEQPGIGKGINNTWAGNWFEYANIDFKYETNIMTISTSTQTPYNGNVVEIIIDDLNNTPVATFTIEDGSWGAKQNRNIKLDTLIPAGNHTIYIKFAGPKGKSSAIYDLGFGYFE